MKIVISCPTNPKHKRFLASAYVMERWEVGEDGSKIRKRGDQTRIEPRTAKPNCAHCGAEAKMDRVE